MSKISTSWHTYSTIYALGHGCLKDLLNEPVLVEEKVDGSQFSFGIFDGEVRCRSKGKDIFLDAPEKMFKKACDWVVANKDNLRDGWTYRAEFLGKPKHNVLAYDRVPNNNLIVFDIATGHETYLPYLAKCAEATRIGLEVVPCLFEGMLSDYSQFQEYLKFTSILGGNLIEGVVVKNYTRCAPDKKILMGKFVSESFKETHAHEWKKLNPSQNDILTQLEMKYKTPARWQKSVQHLKESGVLEGSPRDIGKLIKEAADDLMKECESEIVEDLKKWALPNVRRACTRGLPEWYKEQLAKAQFE